MIAIETRDLVRLFKPSVKALDHVCLNVAAGKVFALLGRNGAGKTTLIKVLSGLILPTSGFFKIKSPLSVSLGNEDRGFYWRLTGRQNLEFFAALYEIPRDQVRAKIAQLTDMFELEDLDKRYDLYSTGQKHRYCLARNFFHDAETVLMDEPTRSLDPIARRCLKRLIRRWTADLGKTFFFTTHDLQEAAELADEIAVLHEGRIVYSASKETFAKPGVSLAKIFDQAAEAEHVF